MFNGIIEGIARIADCISANGSQKIFINIKKGDHNISLGDSIAINGTCLTVDEINSNSYGFTISPETLKITSLKNQKK